MFTKDYVLLLCTINFFFLTLFSQNLILFFQHHPFMTVIWNIKYFLVFLNRKLCAFLLFFVLFFFILSFYSAKKLCLVRYTKIFFVFSLSDMKQVWIYLMLCVDALEERKFLTFLGKIACMLMSSNNILFISINFDLKMWHYFRRYKDTSRYMTLRYQISHLLLVFADNNSL